MRFAIQFDDQSARLAIEINNVRLQWMLPAKFESFKASAAQLLPKNLLRRSHVFAELARQFSELAVDGFHCLLFTPSPAGAKCTSLTSNPSPEGRGENYRFHFTPLTPN